MAFLFSIPLERGYSVKVLFVTSAYPSNESDPRGNFVHRLARGIQREGAGVTVIAPGASFAPSNEILDGVNVQRARYWIPRWQNLTAGFGGIVPSLRNRPWLLLQVPCMISALTWKALRLSRHYDVVHAHWLYPAGIAGSIACARHKVPLIVTSHGSDAAMALRYAPLRWLSARICRSASACVGVSHAVTKSLVELGAPPEHTSFIPLGVDLVDSERFDSMDESPDFLRFKRFDGFRMVFIGRMVSLKSIETLLDAHSELEQRGHSVACALIGSGPSQDSLQAIARRNRSHNIIFAGSLPTAVTQQWLSAGHVLVLPSVSEGRGIVIVEAMAQGLPAVVSDIPGPRELVDDGVTGFLFPAKDVEALANRLEELIQSERLRREMGRRARQFVEMEALTTEHSARKYLALYERLVSGRKARSRPSPWPIQ